MSARNAVLGDLANLLSKLTRQGKINWVNQGGEQYQTEVEGRTFIIRANGQPIDAAIYGFTFGCNGWFRETITWGQAKDTPSQTHLSPLTFDLVNTESPMVLWKALAHLIDMAKDSASANTSMLLDFLRALKE